MINNREVGFVVKRFFPHKLTVCILTRSQGKITVAIKNSKQCATLWPGMFVSFFVTQRERDQSRFVAESVEILSLFPSSKPEDTFWVYHIIELCYFFIPSQSLCPEIFNFFLKIFIVMHHKKELGSHIDVFREISIIKLLILFGFQPHSKIFALSKVFDLLPELSIDFESKQKVELIKTQMDAISPELIKEAKKWAEICLMSHPSAGSFKTVTIQKV